MLCNERQEAVAIPLRALQNQVVMPRTDVLRTRFFRGVALPGAFQPGLWISQAEDSMQFGFELLDSRLAKWVGVKLRAWRQGAGSWGGGNPWEQKHRSRFWIPGHGDKT
jgi:hypothetical protein